MRVVEELECDILKKASGLYRKLQSGLGTVGKREGKVARDRVAIQTPSLRVTSPIYRQKISRYGTFGKRASFTIIIRTSISHKIYRLFSIPTTFFGRS